MGSSFDNIGTKRNIIGAVVLLLILNFFVFFGYVPLWPVSDIPSIRVPYNPIQKRTDKKPWKAKGAKFTPLRSYDITGVVLAKAKYSPGDDPFAYAS
ncbi:MAG: hypothetical protein GY804_01685 [Alphaproteobacteria bacterium]|nr:hypothetical protein [Alphaproteobacteria bacterium]